MPDAVRNGAGGACGADAPGQYFLLSGIAAVLSNLVSGVPAVLVFKSFIGQLADRKRAWLVLAMASTLAGNLTVLGSVANLIVIQQAGDRKRIGFWGDFRVGAPSAVATLPLGAAWIAWRGYSLSNIFS